MPVGKGRMRVGSLRRAGNREASLGVITALEHAERIDAELTRLLNDLDLINTDRRRLAAGAFMVALDVHTSIARLVRCGNHPSAFILSRSIWEATVRGFWLLECASDEQLDAFVNDALDRKTFHMIRDLEATGSFEPDTLSSIHANNWIRLNAMNHVGGPLIVRCNSERGIEYNFDEAEIVECLGNASANALLSAIGLAQSAVNPELGRAIFGLRADAFGQ